MYKIIPAIAFSLFILSCGGSSEESTDVSSNDIDTATVDTLAMDTIQIEVDPNRIVIDEEVLLAKSTETFELPLTIDSTFAEKYIEGYQEELNYNLAGDEANYLSHSFVEDAVTGTSKYDVINFIYMDSLWKAGEDGYQEYQDKLDLGMTRYSVANVVGTVELSDISKLLIWHTDYGTYEACPYGYGICVFATLFTKGVGINTVLVGEFSGGGDPPVWGEKELTSTITATSISIKSIDTWGDEDYETGEEIIETVNKSSEIEITPTGMVCMSNEDGEREF